MAGAGAVLRAVIALLALQLTATPAGADDARNLARSARSWVYQLQGDTSGLAGSRADIAVVDPDHHGHPGGLQRKPGGGRRVVLAYISIGEAEGWRDYFKRCCIRSKPSWLTRRIQGWRGNFAVRFWEQGWKAIVHARIAAALRDGYDGVYLDRADTYETLQAPGGSRSAMIAFVQEIAEQARKSKPGAVVIVQNAEELAVDDAYLAAVDGLAKEDLLYGVNKSGGRNDAADIRESIAHLSRAKAAGRIVLVVEYRGFGAERTTSELAGYGFVALIAPRKLERQMQRRPR